MEKFKGYAVVAESLKSKCNHKTICSKYKSRMCPECGSGGAHRKDCSKYKSKS